MSNREELQTLREKMARQKQLGAVREELLGQLSELEEKLTSLRAAHLAEERDVELLEGRSLTALFYAVIGRKVEKLDAERREAYEAQVRCEVAERELEGVRAQLREVEAELAALRGCESRYEFLLACRREELRASGTPDGEELIRLEKAQAAAAHMHREILEARAAGDRALDSARSVEQTLIEAKRLGTWDLWSGSSLVSLQKHDCLDCAQDELRVLQDDLSRFQTELVDVKLQADIQIGLDRFTRFADWFFDSLWVDLEVQDHIKDSLSRVEQVRETLEKTMKELEEMLAENERASEELGGRLRALIERNALDG